MERFLPHYKKVANILRQRILQGAYALKPLPPESKLAEEIGINYRSVRRGFKLLEEDGVIWRNANGQMEIKRAQQGAKKHFNFGFLMPSSISSAAEVWRSAIEKACSKLPCNLRPVLFMNWEDPILLSALEGFDGFFLSPVTEPLPEALADHLRPPGNSVVVIDHDFSGRGIPSIQMFPPIFVHPLLDHLKTLGHRNIGCLNTQPDNSEIRERINQWRYWMESQGLSGTLADFPVHSHDNPIQQAHRIMSSILSHSKTDTAWFCTTTPAAIGAMSAMRDHKLVPGRDLAICSVNGEGVAAMLNPPLTALEPADAVPFVTHCLEWMIRGGKNWQGPLLMRPLEVPLVIRQSTTEATPQPSFLPRINKAAARTSVPNGTEPFSPPRDSSATLCVP